MKTQIYVSDGTMTLWQVAAKTGVEYATLKKWNPQWKDGVLPMGAKIITRLGDYSTAETSGKTTATKTSASASSAAKSNNTSNAKSKAEEENKKQLRRQKYLDQIVAAETNFKNSKEALDITYSEKRRKLAQTLRNNKIKLESNMAAQKIISSSIAENENQALQRENDAQKMQINNEQQNKLEKLQNNLEKIKKEANRNMALI